MQPEKQPSKGQSRSARAPAKAQPAPKTRKRTPPAAARRAGELVEAPIRIVTFGGGTGLAALLQGLKRFVVPVDVPTQPVGFPLDLSAIVTVSDDGGSSGRLRRAFDILAPGDIRNCMVALAEDEALLSKLFQYRFANGRGLQGHSFGNLFLTALTNVTGDFHQAIQLCSEVLAIRGRIFPSTLANVKLEAQLESGRSRTGETRISGSPERIKSIRLKPRRCKPLPESLEAVARADVITLGPGSLYTSVIPNLLVEGIPQAIAKSSALKIYICNLMWQPGETEGYTASDHLRAIYDHAKLPFVDYVILNSRRPPARLRRRYAQQDSWPVDPDIEELEKQGVKVISADLLAKGAVVRHDSSRLAALISELALEKRRGQGRSR